MYGLKFLTCSWKCNSERGWTSLESESQKSIEVESFKWFVGVKSPLAHETVVKTGNYFGNRPHLK